MDFFGPHLLAYFIATLHFLGTLAAIHAVLTVRTAQGSIAWALSLMFMPYLTLIPYLIFGRSTFDAYIQARRQANQEMHTAITELNWRPWVEEALAARNSSAYASLRAMPKLGRMPCLANNEVRLLINGEATFSAIFDAIRRAKTAVLFQFFIIHDDELGRQLHTLLTAKAAEGVDIHVLYDRIGSHALPHHYVQSLRDAGVKVKAFATRSGWLNRFQVNFRNHRKIVVVDGVTGFVGGHNVGDEYLGKKPPLAPWRDTHVQVTGPVVACLQESFAEDWFWAARELPPLILPDAYPEDGVLCQLLASGPADPYETCSLFSSRHPRGDRARVDHQPVFHPRRSRVCRAAAGGAAWGGCAPAAAVAPRPPHRLRRVQPVCDRSGTRRGSCIPLHAGLFASEGGVGRQRDQRHRQCEHGQPLIPVEFRSDVAHGRRSLRPASGTDAARRLRPGP